MPICNCNDPTLWGTETVLSGGLNGWDSNPQCLGLGFQLHELAFRDASLRFERATLQQRLFRPALQSVILLLLLWQGGRAKSPTCHHRCSTAHRSPKQAEQEHRQPL